MRKGWHVLYVKSKHEGKVLSKLQEIGLEAYLPLVKKEKQWSDRKKISYVPLFNSYVFVHIKSNMELYKSLSVSGACSFISFGDSYAIITQKEIDQLRYLVSLVGFDDIVIEQDLPEIGDYKTITKGVLAGFTCEIVQHKNKNQVKVRLESLQQNIIATLPLEYLN